MEKNILSYFLKCSKATLFTLCVGLTFLNKSFMTNIRSGFCIVIKVFVCQDIYNKILYFRAASYKSKDGYNYMIKQAWPWMGY